MPAARGVRVGGGEEPGRPASTAIGASEDVGGDGRKRTPLRLQRGRLKAALKPESRRTCSHLVLPSNTSENFCRIPNPERFSSPADNGAENRCLLQCSPITTPKGGSYAAKAASQMPVLGGEVCRKTGFERVLDEGS